MEAPSTVTYPPRGERTADADPPTSAVGVRRRRVALGLGGWAALVVIMFGIGAALHPGYPPGDWLPPLHASRRVAVVGVLPALAAGLVAVWVVPRWFARLGWRALLVAAAGVATGWAVVLAVSDGWRQLINPIASEHDYLAAVPGVGSDALGWLDRFTELVPGLPTHPSAHPPLPVLIMWALDQMGLGGAELAAALCIGLGASAVAAIMITLRVVGSEDLARRAAPFLVLAPFALTVATSFDALFLGISAWAVAVLAIAFERRSVALGVVAGALLVAVLYLNYGLIVVGALAIAVAVLRWDRRVVLATLVGGAVVVGLFTAAGFWWFDGVAATHGRWSASHGGNRPYVFTLFGNLAVLALLTGPAVAAAVASVRERALLWIGGAALTGVLALDLAGITRGEVERIWLPLAPWLVAVTAALPPRWVRPALLAQVVLAVAIQMLFRLRW